LSSAPCKPHPPPAAQSPVVRTLKVQITAKKTFLAIY
jgi:hypothetical protein